MRPSARQLIEGIDWSLQNRVAPVTEDKWAASTLRSVHCLLQHLAARVEGEGRLLHDDNSDLRTVLTDVRGLLGEGPQWQGARDAVTVQLDHHWREPGDYPTGESLAAENEALRGVVDRLLLDLHPVAVRNPDGPEAQALAEIDAYIRRRLEREQPFFVPAFLSSTF